MSNKCASFNNYLQTQPFFNLICLHFSTADLHSIAESDLDHDFTDRVHHISKSCNNKAGRTASIPAFARGPNSNNLSSDSSIVNTDESVGSLSSPIEIPNKSKLLYRPPAPDLVCAEPTFSPSEFSPRSVYLNPCVTKGFLNNPLSLDRTELLEKVAIFESYQNIDFDPNLTEYTDQYLAIAISNYDFDFICGEKKSVFLKAVQDFCAIKKIVLIPRSKVPIAYCIDNLGKQYHGTVLNDDSSFQTFLSIFDHIPVQRIHFESSGYKRRNSGIDIKSSLNNIEVAKLSERLW